MNLEEIKNGIEKRNKIWIVPNNDLEAKTIIELLERNGEEYIVTSQGWGASWEMVEAEVFKELKIKGFEIVDEYIEYLGEHDQKVQKVDTEISKIYAEMGDTVERKRRIAELEKEKTQILEERQTMARALWFGINRQAAEKGITIYGVELAGKSRGAIDIDHHNERSNEKSSIEQVADVLKIELSIEEQFIAANDKGSIQAMEELARELGIPEKDYKEIIVNVRNRDRQMQGITIEQELQAKEAVKKLGKLSGDVDYVLVDELPHSKTATIMDRLWEYGIYGKHGNVLIISKDGETNFYGSTEIIEMLDREFKVVDPETGRSNCWKGGLLEQGYGFWGGYADQEAIKEAVQQEIDRKLKAKQEQEKIKEYWLKQYSKDKIGTIAKLSQAMQHGAWLREWQRIHGDEPRVKPITQKVNGEKVKVGEGDIAVPWSKLHSFFRSGNEYGDIETVKFLSEKIESGDISDLTEKEIHDLSERENVKWSNGEHSLNPFQGYLYDFTDKSTAWIYITCEDDLGEFYPIKIYANGVINLMEEEDRIDKADKAYTRLYSTRLLQQILREKQDSKYYDFVNFDITSATTEEQIIELDRIIEMIVNSPEIKDELENIYGDVEYERKFYEKLMEEIKVEVKKDSDRIENAHKVFVALETGELDELLSDPETSRWAKEVYEEENKSRGIY